VMVLGRGWGVSGGEGGGNGGDGCWNRRSAQASGALCRGKEKRREGGESDLSWVEFGVTRWQIIVNTSKTTRTSCNLKIRMRF
jgi:hypothetical protein